MSEHHSRRVSSQGRGAASIGQRGNPKGRTHRCARLTDAGPGSGGAAAGGRAPTGLTVQQVADDIGVHRTIAYRLLSHACTIPADRKGRRRQVSVSGRPCGVRSVVRQQRPTAERSDAARVADELGTTVSLLVAEGDQQVAIAVIVPSNVSYQLSFHEGSRYPLERGAAGSPCSPACPRARANVTSFPRPANRVGSSPTARSNPTPTACRAGEPRHHRLRRHASTSSPIGRMWCWAARKRSSGRRRTIRNPQLTELKGSTHGRLGQRCRRGRARKRRRWSRRRAVRSGQRCVGRRLRQGGDCRRHDRGVGRRRVGSRASTVSRRRIASRGRDGLSARAVARLHGRRPDRDVRADRPGDARLRRGAQRAAVRNRRRLSRTTSPNFPADSPAGDVR